MIAVEYLAFSQFPQANPGDDADAAPAPTMLAQVSEVPAIPNDRMLNQGRFSLCTLNALAVAASSSLGAKFEISIEASRIYQGMLASHHLNAEWPPDAARSVGSIRIQTSDHVYEMSFVLRECISFSTTSWQVDKCAGWRPIVIVAATEGPADERGRRPSHSMVAFRWNRSQRKIQCVNSWGDEMQPFPLVGSDAFGKAYFVDTLIHRVFVPGPGKNVVESNVPAETGEWHWMFPRFWPLC